MTRKLNILIIDDSEDDREVYGRFLRGDSEVEWSIHEAETGEEGMDACLAREFDGILLDYSLPGRNGLKVLSDLVGRNGCLAVVMLTGQGNESVAIECMKSGAQDYLVKDGVTPETLRKSVHNAIERVSMIRKIDEQREALESFSRVLVHDLSGPIHQIRGFCDLMDSAIGDGVYEEARELCENVNESARRMWLLIDTLSKYNKVSQEDVVFESVSMDDVLYHALFDLNGTIEKRGAHVSHDPLPEVTGNAPQLAQLLQNLIGNGIKYCREGIPKVHVAAESVNGSHHISVRDNGIGIPEDSLGSVFEPFKRLHGSDEYPGTGLGLATCKKIVERHKGKIWCESEDGRGSTFTFTLPAAR